MRLRLHLLLTILLGFLLAACHRSPAGQRPDPNPVGQWQWNNPALGSWRLEIKADGTFQREATDRLDGKTVSTSGRWTVKAAESKPTFLEQHRVFQQTSAEDEFLRTVAPDRRDHIQLSAPAVFSLFYYAPKNVERATGAVWTTPTLAEAVLGPAPDETVGMEEKRTLHTFTDTNTGEVFLDLEGKTFRKSAATIASKDAATGTETRDYAGARAAEQPGASADFLNVEAFLGIALDLPRDWEAFDPADPASQAISVSMVTSHRRPPRPNASWRFAPPGSADETFVLLSLQPPSFAAKQLEDASQDDLDRFAAGNVKGAAHLLESKGYFVKPEITGERVHVGELLAVACTGQTIDPTKNVRAIRVYVIPAGAGMIVLTCLWDPEADPPFKPTIDRISSSLRIPENFLQAKP